MSISIYDAINVLIAIYNVLNRGLQRQLFGRLSD